MIVEHRGRTQESRSAAAQALLVGAAIELLADQGFARCTTAAIANRAGVTTGALHHHYPAKEKLFLAVLDQLTERALALFSSLGSAPLYRTAPARALIMDLWSLYGSKQYWAVWEINMGYRADTTMHGALVEHRASTRQQMLQTIEDNPHLSPDMKSMMASSLVFILATLRGIFLDTFFAESYDALLRSELDSLIAVLEQRLVQV